MSCVLTYAHLCFSQVLCVANQVLSPVASSLTVSATSATPTSTSATPTSTSSAATPTETEESDVDSDDEDLVFEEQFILRMPPGEDADRLRKMVQSREVGDDVWFKFKGVFPLVFPAVACWFISTPLVRLSQRGISHGK